MQRPWWPFSDSLAYGYYYPGFDGSLAELDEGALYPDVIESCSPPGCRSFCGARMEDRLSQIDAILFSKETTTALMKTTNGLRNSLLPKEPKSAIPLLLIIAQHRSIVVVNANAPYINMVSEQFHRCHRILLR